MFSFIKAIAELAIKTWLYTLLGKFISRLIDKRLAQRAFARRTA